MAQVNVQDASCKESGPEAWAAGWGKTDPGIEVNDAMATSVRLKTIGRM